MLRIRFGMQLCDAVILWQPTMARCACRTRRPAPSSMMDIVRNAPDQPGTPIPRSQEILIDQIDDSKWRGSRLSSIDTGQDSSASGNSV